MSISISTRRITAGRMAVLSLAVAGVASLPVAVTSAATITKDNNAQSLQTTTSWLGGVVPTSADVGLFDSTVTGPISVTSSLTAIGGLQFTNPGGPVTIGLSPTSTTLTFTNATAIDMSAATQDVTFNNGTLRIASTTYPSAAVPLFNVAAGRTLTIGSAISNQGNTKTGYLNGTGTIVLNGTTGAGGALSFNVNGPSVFLNNATNSGSGWTVTAGTLTLGTNTSLNGLTTTVNGANGLAFGTGVTAPSLGSLAGTGGFALTSTDSNAVALTVGSANTSTTYSGVLSGLGSLTKVGTGTLTLGTAGQSYAGATNVSGGQILASAGGNTQSNILGAGALNLSNGGIFRLNNSGTTTFNSALDVAPTNGTVSFRANTTFSPTAVTGTGTLNLALDNGVTVTPSSFQGFGGTINVTTPGAGATFRLGGTFDNASLANASLNLGAGISATRNAGTSGSITTNIGTLAGAAGSSIGGSTGGAGTFTFSVGARNESATFAGTIVDGLTKTAFAKVGNGTQTLSGANTYTGNTTVSAGTLALDTAGQLKFVIGASGVNNKLTGTAADVLNGTFALDLTNATANAGDTWNLVASTLATTYGSTFGIAGFTNNDGTFTNGTYTFAESTGNLFVAAVPEPTTLAAVAGLGALLIRRRRQA